MEGGRTRPTGRPSLARAAEIGETIVSVTMKLLTEHGVDFSMDQVAATAGISKQAIYRRWPGKTDLVVHVIDRHLELLRDRVQDDLPRDRMAALREIAWRIFEQDTRVAVRVMTFLDAEGARHEPLGRCIAAWQQWRRTTVRDQLMCACPDIDAALASALAEVLQSLLIGIRCCAVWETEHDRSSEQRFEECWNVFALLLEALPDSDRAPDPDQKNAAPGGREN